MSRRLLGLAAFGVLASAASAQVTVRVSVDRNRKDANGASGSPAMTPDARFVAFASDASDLVPDDVNGCSDVFVRDRMRGVTERVSVDSSESQGNGASFDPAISDDGRFIVFTSEASNLVMNDTNHWSDVFVRDCSTRTTRRVSVATGGGQGSEGSFSPVVSGDGSTIAYVSQAPDLVQDDRNTSWDVFVFVLATGRTERASVDSAGVEGDSGSLDPALSADGRLVAFASLASNLVAGDHDTVFDVFVHDRSTVATERVTLGLMGAEPDDLSVRPSLSADGQLVAFESFASNLVAGDQNGCCDVFVCDRATGAMERMSVDSAGAECGGDSRGAVLTPSGRWVGFTSSAPQLVAGDGNDVDDVFVHDRHTRMTLRASVARDGSEGDGASGEACLSENADNVAFSSVAANLVVKDGNDVRDVFSREQCVREAAFTHYGNGWPGTFGEPQLLPAGDPELNRPFRLEITNSSGLVTPAFLLVGPRKLSLPTNRGGGLLVDAEVGLLICLPAGGGFIDCPLPAEPSACGVELDLQVLEFDPGASLQISFSQGLELVFGY